MYRDEEDMMKTISEGVESLHSNGLVANATTLGKYGLGFGREIILMWQKTQPKKSKKWKSPEEVKEVKESKELEECKQPPVKKPRKDNTGLDNKHNDDEPKQSKPKFVLKKGGLK